MKADKQTWVKAQMAERKFHTHTFEEGNKHYNDSYNQYFKYLDIKPSIDKVIMEIGCADFPALSYCDLKTKCYIIEPMPSQILLNTISKSGNLILIDKPFEEIETLPNVDEVWLMNVLQHVIDPDVILNKCKEISNTIRYFEPINAPLNECHLHAFDIDYFKRFFGDSVKHYPKNNTAVNFHQWECAYGVWNK